MVVSEINQKPHCNRCGAVFSTIASKVRYNQYWISKFIYSIQGSESDGVFFMLPDIFQLFLICASLEGLCMSHQLSTQCLLFIVNLS